MIAPPLGDRDTTASVSGRILLAAALAAGAVSVLWGSADLAWPQCVPFTKRGLVTFVGFMLGASGAIYLLSSRLGLRTWAAAAAVCVVLAACAGSAWSMVWVATCGLSFVVVGDAISRAIGCGRDRDELRWLVDLCLGSIAYGSVLELASALPVHNVLTYFAMVVSPLVVWRSRCMELLRAVASGVTASNRSARPASAAAALTAGLASYYVAVGLLPETGYDALVFHLAVSFEYARQGQWHMDTATMLYSLLPKHAQCLYALGFMQGGEAGARLMNTGFILCTGIQIYVLARRYSPRYSGTCATLSLALFLSSPLSFTEGANLFVESVWALYTVTALAVLLRRGGFGAVHTWIVAVGLLLAGAVAAKPQALLTSAAIFLIITPALFRDFPRPPRAGFLAWAGIILLVAAQPYARSWILAGSPVFPYFNEFFKAEGFPATSFVDTRWLKPVTWSFLYDLQFHSGNFIEGMPGALGFHWLALLPACAIAAALSRSRAGLTLLAASLLMCACLFFFIRYLRYVFPALCACTPIIGIGIASMTPSISRVSLCLGALCVAANLLFLPSASHYHSSSPLAAAFSERAREQYLLSEAPVRLAAQTVNSLNLAARPVAFLCEPAGAECGSLALYDEWYNRGFNSAIAQSASAEELSRLLCDRGVDYVILSDNWRTGDRRQAVESITDEIVRMGKVQIRRVREADCLSTEALQDPGFVTLANGSWSWTASVERGCHSDGGVLVSESVHGHQTVAAIEGKGYVLTVAASGSGSGANCRTQVIWRDRKNRVLRVDLEAFAASQSGSTHRMRGIVPRDATSGVVYATGHSDAAPACVTSVSLKWRD